MSGNFCCAAPLLSQGNAWLLAWTLPLSFSPLPCRTIRWRLGLGLGSNNGQTQTRQVQQTRWEPSSGAVDHFFDDELVCASVGVNQDLLRQIDPFDREGLLILADRAANAGEKLKILRAALRNEEVIAPLATMIAATAQDPVAQEVLRQWLADADKALAVVDPAQWPDPLALELA